jgi:hypothetical protein
MSTQNKIKQRENEKKFGTWEELPDGGRKYIYVVKGRYEWSSHYIKEVDIDEQTLRFYQNIYDDNGLLIEIHEKYPEDKGHRKIKDINHENYQ